MSKKKCFVAVYTTSLTNHKKIELIFSDVKTLLNSYEQSCNTNQKIYETIKFSVDKIINISVWFILIYKYITCIYMYI